MTTVKLWFKVKNKGDNDKMDEELVKTTRLFYDPGNETSIIETLETNIQPIGSDLTPDETYLEYRKMLGLPENEQESEDK